MAKPAKKKDVHADELHVEGHTYSRSTLENMHDQMLFIRRFEEKAGQLYGLKKIGGFCHLCNGQEAVPVGAAHALRAEDYVLTSYRDHGHALARGCDPESVMAELLGRGSGLAGGKGGSMHMFDKSRNFAGGNGIVGEQVPTALGFGFACQYREDGRTTICFLGDGAINQGAVYESFNIAALWKLPIVFVVENNQYAMGTALNRASAETHLFKRGISFKLPGMQINGMDVLEVERHMSEAVSHARSGAGPMLVEAITYRYRGHSMSDPATYRSRDEVNEWRSGRDPIVHVRNIMIDAGLSTEEAFKEKDREIKKRISEIARQAEGQAEPETHKLFENVYRNPLKNTYPDPDGVN